LCVRRADPCGARDVLVLVQRRGLLALRGAGRFARLERAALGGRGDRADVHDLVVDLETVREAAELRDPHVERRLAALEPGRNRPAGPGLLALRAATGGLALARGDAPPDPGPAGMRAGGRAQIGQLHDGVFSWESDPEPSISSTLTRNRTWRTMPRVASLSGTSTGGAIAFGPTAQLVRRS